MTGRLVASSSAGSRQDNRPWGSSREARRKGPGSDPRTCGQARVLTDQYSCPSACPTARTSSKREAQSLANRLRRDRVPIDIDGVIWGLIADPAQAANPPKGG